MSTDIKVSIIVPVYKVPLNYLRECFDSLLAQTMQECEFIVVSDGAPEAECAICEKYASKDSRLKFFKREHAGVSATRNYGIEQAQGEYITFVDADDTISPDFCKEPYSFGQRNYSDIILFDFNPVGNQFKKEKYASSSKKILSFQDVKEIRKQIIHLTDDRFAGAVSTICKLTKASLIKKNNIAFPVNISIAEDRPFSYQIFTFAKKISYLSSSLYNYNLNEDSATHDFNNNSFLNISAYLLEIHKFSDEYKNLISFCIVGHFFRCWQTYYFNRKNTANLRKNIHELCAIVRSEKFNYFFKKVDLKNFKFHVKFEIFFIRHKSTLLIWLHGIKYILSKKLKF